MRIVYRSNLPPAVADITGESIVGLMYQDTEGEAVSGSFTPTAVTVASQGPSAYASKPENGAGLGTMSGVYVVLVALAAMAQ